MHCDREPLTLLLKRRKQICPCLVIPDRYDDQIVFDGGKSSELAQYGEAEDLRAPQRIIVIKETDWLKHLRAQQDVCNNDPVAAGTQDDHAR